MTFSPLIIWAKATFFFEQLFPVVARTWLILKSDSLFLGPKFWFLVQKSDFCHTTPILVNDPFLALGMTVNFPPWKRFFDFPFRSYSCFRKKIWLTAQKVFPLPTVGAPSASKSPSALSAQALRASGLIIYLPCFNSCIKTSCAAILVSIHTFDDLINKCHYLIIVRKGF